MARYPYAPVRIAKIKNTDNIRGWFKSEQMELQYITGENPLRKLAFQFLKKLNIHVMYDPAVHIYFREMKTYVYTRTYTQISIAALFVIAKTGNGNSPNILQQVNG